MLCSPAQAPWRLLKYFLNALPSWVRRQPRSRRRHPITRRPSGVPPADHDPCAASVLALVLSVSINPVMPWARRITANSARRVASSLIVPLR